MALRLSALLGRDQGRVGEGPVEVIVECRAEGGPSNTPAGLTFR